MTQYFCNGHFVIGEFDEIYQNMSVEGIAPQERIKTEVFLKSYQEVEV